MKAHLLYRDRDIDWRWVLQAAAEREATRAGRRRRRDSDWDPGLHLPWNSEALSEDLELDTLFTAMAGGDKLIFEVARTVLLTGLANDLETIRYRQGVLQDCLNHPAVLRRLYAIAIEATEQEKKHYLSSLTRHPDSVLRWSIEVMDALLAAIKDLRQVADLHGNSFESEGWVEFFSMLKRELTDDYCALIRSHLRRLRFRSGVLLSARLGKGNKGTRYVLHRPPLRRGTWLPRIFGRQPPVYRFSLHPRDENGARMLAELQGRGIGIAATALRRSAEHVRSFFAMLRIELAFYVGCVNLYERLARKGEPICLPSAAPAAERLLSFRGLYDVCLTLNVDERVVGNDGDADGKDLVMVTGANQGGKSTFLRSVGLAQLMMQCGMFVAADSFRSSICDGLFTHCRREEDPSLKSGKLDEELGRMSEIVDHVTPFPLILLNESFAATNEREGAQIANQITSAMLEKRVRMVFVTHLYEFARGACEKHAANALFLRAERLADGRRTFKLIEGEPLDTSFGEDLYDGIFGSDASYSEARSRRRRVGCGRRPARAS